MGRVGQVEKVVHNIGIVRLEELERLGNASHTSSRSLDDSHKLFESYLRVSLVEPDDSRDEGVDFIF